MGSWNSPHLSESKVLRLSSPYRRGLTKTLIVIHYLHPESLSLMNGIHVEDERNMSPGLKLRRAPRRLLNDHINGTRPSSPVFSPRESSTCFYKARDSPETACRSHNCKRSFTEYRGKVVLITNVATMSDNARKEFTEMNCLVEELGCENFSLLAFPSNTFGDHHDSLSPLLSRYPTKEPGDNEEILNMLKCVRPGCDFQPKFEMFQKADVNGEEESSIFKYLKKKLPVPQDCPLWIAGSCKEIRWKPILRTDISGNFEKFLVNHRGVPVQR
ncbi:unnamed protein product [Notodromas monacha]|uniref:glutathione peroxidase n=1 Tax=Notodromas monacha TaxID=399045 RepID=A0A7R9C219_9CRUS|nr:unnamed protein product [Notodromas monacha]CAG0924962.1 unnamed protein product [Notodromas monacha]